MNEYSLAKVQFNDFIVMFLIIRKIYLLLYRTHVKLEDCFLVW